MRPAYQQKLVPQLQAMLQMPQEASSSKLSYIVLPGNESILMADAMAKRSWWKAVEKGSPNNFWWGGNGQRFGWQDFQSGEQTTSMQ